MDETEKMFVTTTDTVVKEVDTDMGTKPNMVKEAITHPIAKNKIDKVNKTEKSQASNKTLDTSISKKSDKGKSLDKSRSAQRTGIGNTVNTVNKSRSVSGNSLSNKITRTENPQK